MAPNLIQTSPGFLVNTDYGDLLSQVGLNSVKSVFAFEKGEHLTKSNLASWRQRTRFQLPSGEFAYLKRYEHPPKNVQLKAWFQHGRHAFLSRFDQGPADKLQQAGINIPQILACGGQWAGLYEKRSFIITLELKNAASLEKQLPGCFDSASPKSQKERKDFTRQLADFVRRFHETGFRHRDLYLSHIFYSDDGSLSLIDLQRCFRPKLLKQRFRIKDLAQLHYSCDGHVISRTDRLRFYRVYRDIKKLAPADKILIAKIHRKALQIAWHDRRHGRPVPFERSVKEGMR